MYWRQVSIQDGQASTSTWWRQCSETGFHENFVIFRHRSKRVALLKSVNFSMCCVCMQIFNFRDDQWSHDHFSAPFRGLYLPNALSQTPQISKRHTFRVSAFHRYHWFWVKLFPVGCAQDSRRYPKNAKNAVFASGSAHTTKFRNFSR